MIYADQRWIGNHGIGRFAKHVLAGLEYRTVDLRSRPSSALDSWCLSLALKRLAPDDLFFSPGYNPPLFCPSHFVFTIHDLSHIDCPELHRPQFALYYATVMKGACRRAHRILTVSEFTRRQILDWSEVPMEKVVNVGCGVDPMYKPDGEVYGFPFPYLLSVSNHKPHKNDFRLVDAFARANLDKTIHLVFTGDPQQGLLGHIDTHHLRSRVDFMGIVSEEKMPSLYRGAQALIFPSLYEGFGLPILEAMACGVPVVTSNVASMPEVAADAALAVDPRSVDEIAQAIQQIVGDAVLRQRLRERGFKRAARFSWGTTANKVHTILFEAGCRRKTSEAML